MDTEMKAEETTEKKTRVKKSTGPTCPECGNENIFSEIITGAEWQGDKEVKISFTKNTCLNLDCGHSWKS